MNPFASAKLIGKNANEVVNFLSQWNPEMGKRIKQALALGYTADEVVNFLGNTFDTSNPKKEKDALPQYERALRIMGERKPEAVKQARAERERDVISDVLDPNRLIAGAAGAGLGALTGGPAGAVAGGIGGVAGYGDLLQRYRKHVEQGGQMSLADWIKSILKGAGVGAAASQAPKIASAIQGMMGQGQEEPQAQPEQAAPQEVPPPAPSPVSGKTPEESFQIIEAKGAGDLFKQLAEQIESPGQMLLALQKLYGSKFTKDIETEHNRPAREIIEEAFNFVKGSSAQDTATTPETLATTPETLVTTPELGFDASAGVGHPDLQNYIAEIGKIDTGERPKELKRDVKELQALKSSNVRYADYDPESQKLQVLFAPSGKNKAGEIYEYFDVPREDVETMMKGSGTAVTTGSNMFRAWFGGKNPSIGRAFHDFIKQKDAKGDAVYPYRKISEQYVNDKDLLKVRGADTVFKTAQYVEAFEDLVLKSQAKTRSEGLKLASSALKELPDDLLEQMVFEVTKAISKETKTSKAAGKTKRYKGGKEKEIQRRVEEKAKAAGGG